MQRAAPGWRDHAPLCESLGTAPSGVHSPGLSKASSLPGLRGARPFRTLHYRSDGRTESTIAGEFAGELANRRKPKVDGRGGEPMLEQSGPTSWIKAFEKLGDSLSIEAVCIQLKKQVSAFLYPPAHHGCHGELEPCASRFYDGRPNCLGLIRVAKSSWLRGMAP
jgi:hypothetical protein